MSNLSSAVKFDIVRGWPDGGAIDETFTVPSGTVIKEGQFVVLDSTTGGVKLPTAIAAQAAAAGPTKLRLVIQGTDQSDAAFLSKVVTLRGDCAIKTEKFVAGAYTAGQLLTLDVTDGGATQGYLKARTASNEQVVGEVEAYDSTNGVLTVSLSL